MPTERDALSITLLFKFFSTKERKNIKIGTTHTESRSVGSANLHPSLCVEWIHLSFCPPTLPTESIASQRSKIEMRPPLGRVQKELADGMGLWHTISSCC